MAANTKPGMGGGQTVRAGDTRTVIEESGTFALRKGSGKLARVIVWDAGSGWTLAVYDDPSAANAQVWAWATADGKGTFDLEIPLADGLYVVTASGTPGSLTIVWS